MSFIKELGVQQFSGEYPRLPEFEEMLELLTDLLEDVRIAAVRHPDSLIDFYYPLIAVVYRLSNTSFEKHYLFPDEAKKPELGEWFWKFSWGIGELLEAVVYHLNPDNNTFYDHWLIAYVDEYQLSPFQWNEVTLIWIAQWISLMLKRENHRGTPPFYIYISGLEQSTFPVFLPKIFEGMGWISGFGGRFLVLPGALKLTDAQKTELWNHMIVVEDIYDDKTIDHSVREKVFEEISNRFPSGEINHLDLCGGRGDFILWLRAHGFTQITSKLIDIADEAVARATDREIDASAGSAEQQLVLNSRADVITIIFAVQWLTAQAFTNVFDGLRSGGTLLANVYPPDPERVEALIAMLSHAGFINIGSERSESSKGKTVYVVWAEKPGA